MEEILITFITISIASRHVPKFKGPFVEDFKGKEWKLTFVGSQPKETTQNITPSPGSKKEEIWKEEKVKEEKEEPKTVVDYSQHKKAELEKVSEYIADKKVKEEQKMKNEINVYKQRLLASAEKEKLERMDEISKEIEEFKKRRLEKLEEIIADELEERKKQINFDLTKDKDNLDQTSQERDVLKSQNEKLAYDIRSLKRENIELKGLESKCAEDEKKIEKLTGEIENLKSDNLKLNTEIIDVKERKEEYEFKLKEYERKMERLFMEKRDLETKKNDEIRLLKDEIQLLTETKLRDDPEIIETLKNELTEQARSISTLKLENESQRKTIEDLQNKIIELQNKPQEVVTIKEAPQLDFDKIRQEIQKDLEKDYETKKLEIEEEKEKMKKEKEELERKQKEDEEKRLKESQGPEKKKYIASKMSIFMGRKERSDSFISQGNPELLQKIDQLEKNIKQDAEIHEKQIINLMTEIRNLNVSREQLMNAVFVSQQMQKLGNQAPIENPKLQRNITVQVLGSGKKGPPPPVPKKGDQSPSTNTQVKDDTKIFGMDVSEVMKRKNQEGFKIPKEIQAIINHLEKNGLKDEGIFRVPGEVEFVKEMKEAIDKGKFVLQENEKNYPVLASLLKLYFRELPQPLLLYQNYNAFLTLIENKEANLEKIKDLVNTIPIHYKNLLETLLNLLSKVLEHGSSNKMTVSSLSIVFGMNLLKSKDETPLIMMRDCKKVNEVCALLLTNPKIIQQ